MRPSGGAFRSLSVAMFRGFVRDRVAMVFSILIPVLFLLLFGSIYKDSGTARISVIEVGRVSLLDQAAAGSHGQLGKVMTISRSASLAGPSRAAAAAGPSAASAAPGGEDPPPEASEAPAREAMK